MLDHFPRELLASIITYLDTRDVTRLLRVLRMGPDERKQLLCQLRLPPAIRGEATGTRFELYRRAHTYPKVDACPYHAVTTGQNARQLHICAFGHTEIETAATDGVPLVLCAHMGIGKSFLSVATCPNEVVCTFPKPIRSVSVASLQTYVVTEDGKLYGCGLCFLTSSTVPAHIPTSRAISKVACGTSAMPLALDTDGNLYETTMHRTLSYVGGPRCVDIASDLSLVAFVTWVGDLYISRSDVKHATKVALPESVRIGSVRISDNTVLAVSTGNVVYVVYNALLAVPLSVPLSVHVHDVAKSGNFIAALSPTSVLVYKDTKYHRSREYKVIARSVNKCISSGTLPGRFNVVFDRFRGELHCKERNFQMIVTK